jgi:hypothetical protein
LGGGFCVEIFCQKGAEYACGEPLDAYGTRTQWQSIDPKAEKKLDEAN